MTSSAADFIAFQGAVNAALQFKFAEAKNGLEVWSGESANPKGKFLEVVRLSSQLSERYGRLPGLPGGDGCHTAILRTRIAILA